MFLLAHLYNAASYQCVRIVRTQSILMSHLISSLQKIVSIV